MICHYFISCVSKYLSTPALVSFLQASFSTFTGGLLMDPWICQNHTTVSKTTTKLVRESKSAISIQNITTGLAFKDKVSVAWITDGSEGLWNSKCAMDRSMGFVSVSISIYPVHLNKTQLVIFEGKEENKLIKDNYYKCKTTRRNKKGFYQQCASKRKHQTENNSQPGDYNKLSNDGFTEKVQSNFKFLGPWLNKVGSAMCQA